MSDKSIPLEPIKYDFGHTRPDVFEVTGMKQKRDKLGNVVTGYVYRWGNVSDGNEVNAEVLKREYYEPCLDPDVKGVFATSDGKGTPQFIKRNGERYQLLQRPVEAAQQQYEYENALRTDMLKEKNEFSGTKNVKHNWKFKKGM